MFARAPVLEVEFSLSGMTASNAPDDVRRTNPRPTSMSPHLNSEPPPHAHPTRIRPCESSAREVMSGKVAETLASKLVSKVPSGFNRTNFVWLGIAVALESFHAEKVPPRIIFPSG